MKLRRIMGCGPERVRVEFTDQVWHVDAGYSASWVRLASNIKLRAALREAYEFASENSG